MKPYTYYLIHIPTKVKYYGVRLSPKADPKQDLWVHYFSSSDAVHDLITKYGKESFLVEVRKVFEDSTTAYNWEQKVLKRLGAVEKPDWLNKHYSGGPWYWKGPRSDTTKLKMAKAWKKRSPMKEETKEKIRNSLKGRKRPEEVCLKMRKKKTFKNGISPNLGKTNNYCFKPVKTPLGIFESILAASKAHECKPNTMSHRVRRNMKGYSYLDK